MVRVVPFDPDRLLVALDRLLKPALGRQVVPKRLKSRRGGGDVVFVTCRGNGAAPSFLFRICHSGFSH